MVTSTASTVGSLPTTEDLPFQVASPLATDGRPQWWSMPAKLIRLRYAGTCAGCSGHLPAGTKAWWDADARSTTCTACRATPATVPIPETPQESMVSEPTPPPPAPMAVGEAGASARHEYERRHERREQRIDQRWGRLSGVVKFLSDDPQSTKAWARGSEGERRLAAHLLRAVGDRAVLLHDRRVPGTRGNIDHLAIASSGVWVIDAKHYKGSVEQRDVGGWFKTDKRLYVAGRDRTKIAEGLGWQVNAVQRALGEASVPINAALCFIEAEWKLFAKPFQQNGVWVTWAKKLAEMIAEPGPLTPENVTDVAERLARSLPPAGSSTTGTATT
jgi:hypothetical protein